MMSGWIQTIWKQLSDGTVVSTKLTRECPDCHGQGSYMVERSVIDYSNGGYLEEVQETCSECSGVGMLE